MFVALCRHHHHHHRRARTRAEGGGGVRLATTTSYFYFRFIFRMGGRGWLSCCRHREDGHHPRLFFLNMLYKYVKLKLNYFVWDIKKNEYFQLPRPVVVNVNVNVATSTLLQYCTLGGTVDV